MAIDWLDKKDLDKLSEFLDYLTKKYVKLDNETEKDLDGDWVIDQLHGDVVSSIVELLNHLEEKKEMVE